MPIINDKLVTNAVEAATDFEYTDDTVLASSAPGDSILGVLRHYLSNTDDVPAWWSPARDRYLRSLWKENGRNYLATAMYVAQSKLVGIPCHVVAKNSNVVSHRIDAENYEYVLRNVSGFGSGLDSVLERFYEDYLSQDNGGFLEILGEPSDPREGYASPISGAPLGVRHLDAARCIRTDNPEYPVLYRGDSGKLHKLHFTRVIFLSQQPSSIAEMNGVGFCAVSRAIDFAQGLKDIGQYKREKLGSSPPSKLFVGKGVPASEILKAFRLAQQASDSLNSADLMAKFIAIGSQSTDIDIQDLDLTSMSEFSEDISIPYGMYSVALAFGLEPGELWPSSAGSKDSANLQMMRSRGKLPSQVTSALAREFNAKYLPPHLELVFDFKDDDEDQKIANIRDIRARNRVRNMTSNVTDIATERQLMIRSGDITQEDYNEMEMRSGRLEDGRPIESLIYSTDPIFNGDNGLLNIQDLDIYTYSDEVLSELRSRLPRIYQYMNEYSTNSNKLQAAKYAHALITKLINDINYLSIDNKDEYPNAKPPRDGDRRGERNSNRT